MRSRWDHPRGCGENWEAKHNIFYDEDHPRGCGENTPTITQERNSKGSPPRMRGKLAVCRGDSVFNGITPADAGKTVAVVDNPCR